MRIWHKSLIPYLPRQQLLGQWRECCAIAKSIAEKGMPNHVLVNRIMEYPDEMFNDYAVRIWHEMKKRGYYPDAGKFFCHRHRNMGLEYAGRSIDNLFYGWHNDRYLRQCLANLQEKADCGAIPAEEWKRITDRWPEME